MKSKPKHSAPAARVNIYAKKFDELKTVFDNLPDGVVAILDENINIATANKAISEMLELPLDEIIGRNASDFFKDKIPGLNEVLLQTLESRIGVRNYTLEFVAQDGDVHSFLISTAIIDETSDTDLGIVLILHDVSEMSRLRKIALHIDRYGEVVGKSKAMKNIYALVESIKDYNTSVLIVGETGTGKELIARSIHNSSNRKNKPFIPVNCSALPENLIESELFGHVKGAFTGAVNNNIGRFKAADEGTLFLDEVGTLPLDVQVKLLRALQEKTIEPVGSSESIPVDIRVVSATNRDLTQLVAKNMFREDLYYRLKVIQINLPALRDRKKDIPLLVGYFIASLNRYHRKKIIGISKNAEDLINNYAWPGNVRELKNAIEHAFVIANGALIGLNDLPPELRHSSEDGLPPQLPEIDLSTEEERIKRALLSTRGNRGQAATMLNMHRTTLWRKMKEFRIDKAFGKLKP
jgi:two-component system response regulator HydG